MSKADPNSLIMTMMCFAQCFDSFWFVFGSIGLGYVHGLLTLLSISASG